MAARRGYAMAASMADPNYYPGRLPPAVHRLVVMHGTEQTGREVPPSWRRRRTRIPGGCYTAAGRWAARDSAVSYAEGHASRGHDLWVPHAWLVDEDGAVIDLAWEEPAEARYVGLIVPTVLMARVTVKYGLDGPVLPCLIAGGWHPSAGAIEED